MTNKIYLVFQYPYQNITVVDGSTYGKISSEDIGTSLSGITVNPKNDMLYVTNPDASRVFATYSNSGRIERMCLLFVLLASISTTFMLQFHVEALATQ
jgi:DNA-binding beta-propeller fold protein YncE